MSGNREKISNDDGNDAQKKRQWRVGTMKICCTLYWVGWKRSQHWLCCS